MLRRIISVLLVSFFLSIVAKAYAPEPTIQSSLNKKQISVGERIKLTIEIEWRQEEEYSLIITHITPPSSVLLKQVDSKQRASSRLTKDGVFARTLLEYTYIGKEKGSSDITPAVIEYSFSGNPENKRIIKAQPIPVKVISRTAGFRNMALKGISGILSAVLIFGLFVLLKRRVIFTMPNKRKKTDNDSGYSEKRFCEKLRDLNKHKVMGDTSAYYAGIEKALLDYVKEKYSGDLSSESMDKFPKDLQKICAECKFMAEKVRFSGYKPQENEQDRLSRELTKYMRSLMVGKNEEDLIETIDPVRK